VTAAGGDELRDGSNGVFAGERHQVGEAEAAPRRMEYGEPCDAVGGMEQCPGQSEGVEDLRTFVQGIEFNATEVDVVCLELLHDGVEMTTGACQHGDAPGMGAPRG